MLITDDIDEIRSIVESTRKTVLRSTEDRSRGTCLHVSLAVAQSIRRNCPMITVEYRGGNVQDADGNQHGHYWLEISDSEFNRVIIDSTADQFGYKKVEIAEVDNQRYFPIDQSVVDAHFRHLMDELAEM